MKKEKFDFKTVFDYTYSTKKTLISTLVLINLFTFGLFVDKVDAVTEFTSSIKESGGDYSSLFDWEVAVQTDLTANTTRVFSGSVTGTLTGNDVLELFRGGVYQSITGSLVATSSTQILLDGVSSASLTVQDGDQWRLASSTSNMFSMSGTGDELGDSAIAVGEIDGAWTNPDTTAVVIDGWTTSATNYIKIYTTAEARHEGVWDEATKYRMRVDSGAGTYALDIPESYITIEGLQIEVWNLYNMTAVAIRGGGIHIKGNIIKNTATGTNNGVTFNTAGVGVGNYLYNNILYGWDIGIIHSAEDENSPVYNNTLVNCTTGIDGHSQNTLILKNNIISGSTTSFVDTFHADSDYNATDTGTATGGANDKINQTFTFTNEAGDDFHLASGDTAAIDAGTDLSADANLSFTTDIDGETRSGTWDIGADEQSGVTPPTNSITISSLTTSNETTTTFNTAINFTGDDNSNAVTTLYYCNETDSPSCDPTSGTSQTMTRGTGTYTYSTTGLSSPNDAGDTLNIRVVATDTDGVTGSPLNTTVQLGTAPDTTPPATTSDLAVSSCTATACNLTWTAPGDDSTTGTPTSYDIKYSTSNITNDTDFNNATSASGEPTPSIAGTTETLTVTGLTTGTTYYFALKTSDEVPNTSELSNVPNYTTPAPDTTAPTVPLNLQASAISSSQINLTWTASTDAVGVTGYNIYRCTGSCTPTVSIGTSATNSYSDTGLTAETTYTYSVEAYDAVANTSAQTSGVGATTQVASGGTNTANYPLEIIQPQPNLNTSNRYYKAYPGIEYKVPIGVFGGAYPFTYSLTTSPSGMIIDNDTGIITWSNPTTSGSPHPVTVNVTDAESTQVTRSWTITVTTDGFVFIDNVNGSRDGAGTINDPLLDMIDIGGTTYDDMRDTTYNNYFVYFRNGTYDPAGYVENSGQQLQIEWRGSYKPVVWLEYPGETVVIDHNRTQSGAFIDMQNDDNTDLFIHGIKFQDMLNHAIRLGNDRVVFFESEFYNLGPGIDGANSSFLMFHATLSEELKHDYALIKNCTFDTLNTGAFLKLYAVSKFVVEDNTFSNGSGDPLEGIASKGDNNRYVDIRGNTIVNIPTQAIGGNWAGERDIEIRYNNVKNSLNDFTTNLHGALTANYHDTAGQAFIHHNTFEGTVTVKWGTSDDGPFNFYNNVIVNQNSGTPSGSHITHYSVADPSRIIIGTGSESNLVGYPSDNIIDLNGDLTEAYSSYIGTHGHVLSDTPPPADTTPPTLSTPSPSGTQPAGTTSTTLSITTNENATCKYGTTSGVAYASIPNTFSGGGSTSHTSTITGLTNGNTYNYYIRCNDTSNNENTSDYTINFSIAVAVVDNDAPTNPTININSGAIYSTNQTVTLTLSATDVVGVTEMAFANESDSYSTWEAYTTSKTWNLSTTDGTPNPADGQVKTVNVRYRDVSGNESTPVSDTIILDTIYPTVSGINADVTSTTVNDVTTAEATITWTTSEPSTTQLEYGFTASYGTLTTEDTTLTTSHTVNLENLSADGTDYNFRVVSRDSANNTTISTNQTFTTPGTVGSDVTSPSTVTDLASSNISQTSVDLNWTAPGDDSNTGTASIYDVRYSTSELSENTWGQATLLEGEPVPSIVGSAETVYIAVGLLPNTTYYFALKTLDETGNTSIISNVITFTTLDETVAPPVVTTPTVTGGGGGGGIITDTSAPAQPTKLKVTSADSQITLTWINPTDTDFVRTVIFRTTLGATIISNGLSLTEQTSLTPDNLREDNRFTLVYEGDKEEYTDVELDNTTTYYYYISTYDKKPNFSQFYIQQAQPESGKDSINIEVELIVSASESEAVQSELEIHNIIFKNDLYLGLENEEVKKLQEILSHDTELYPEGITSGYYGNLTVKAIQRFQCRHNIVCEGTPTTTGYGTFGPKTRVKFNEVYGSSSVSTSVSEVVQETFQPTQTTSVYKLTKFLWAGQLNDEVKKLQEALSLNKEIYPEGITSGYYGNLTTKAVQRFQCKYTIVCEGTPSSTGYGIVGSKTLAKFNEVYSSLVIAVTGTAGATGGSVVPVIEEELIDSLQDQINTLLDMVASLTAELNRMLTEGV